MFFFWNFNAIYNCGYLSNTTDWTSLSFYAHLIIFTCILRNINIKSLLLLLLLILLCTESVHEFCCLLVDWCGLKWPNYFILIRITIFLEEYLYQFWRWKLMVESRFPFTFWPSWKGRLRSAIFPQRWPQGTRVDHSCSSVAVLFITKKKPIGASQRRGSWQKYFQRWRGRRGRWRI